MPAGRRGPVEYMLARIADGAPIEGPLDPALCADRPADHRQRRAVGAREARGAARAMSETDLDTYALKAAAAAEVAAPDLPYRPPLPRAYRPRIALVGAGGIAAAHLAAYRAAGFDVAVICNRTLARGRGAARRVLPRRRGDRRHRAHARPRRHRGRRPHAAPGRAAADDRGGARGRQARAVAEAVRASTSTPARGSATSPTRRACGSRSTRTAAGRRTSPGCARRCAPG